MPKNKHEYIDTLIKDFSESYYSFNHFEYDILNWGKERSMVGKILKKYKEKFPLSNSEQTREGLKKYWDLCVSINDDWLRKHMSLSIIVSKFNAINNILRNGKTGKKGTTNREIAETIIHHFQKRR